MLLVTKKKNRNPLHVKEIPPLRILEESGKQLNKILKTNATAAVDFKNVGVFNIQSLRALKQIHQVIQIKREVEFEKKWIPKAFG